VGDARQAPARPVTGAEWRTLRLAIYETVTVADATGTPADYTPTPRPSQAAWPFKAERTARARQLASQDASDTEEDA
jgi:hypothetical protein